jgi:LytS/YehU family sensor histidine kinase
MPLSEIIEMLRLYMEIEKARQSNRFSYKINIGKGVRPEQIVVPGLALQPLVENAIVHGLYNKKNGRGLLTLSFSKKGDALQAKVSDNGIGRKQSAKIKKAGHSSQALSIIRETIDLSWNGKVKENTFVIKDRVDKNGKAAGTEAIVLLPLAK